MDISFHTSILLVAILVQALQWPQSQAFNLGEYTEIYQNMSGLY